MPVTVAATRPSYLSIVSRKAASSAPLRRASRPSSSFIVIGPAGERRYPSSSEVPGRPRGGLDLLPGRPGHSLDAALPCSIPLDRTIFPHLPREMQNHGEARGVPRLVFLAAFRYNLGAFPVLCVPVAQLDRALDSGSKGRRFESSQARHVFPHMASEIIGLGRIQGLRPICLRLSRFAHVYPLMWHKYDPNVAQIIWPKKRFLRSQNASPRFQFCAGCLRPSAKGS